VHGFKIHGALPPFFQIKDGKLKLFEMQHFSDLLADRFNV
jgi:hypothetical protein